MLENVLIIHTIIDLIIYIYNSIEKKIWGSFWIKVPFLSVSSSTQIWEVICCFD